MARALEKGTLRVTVDKDKKGVTAIRFAVMRTTKNGEIKPLPVQASAIDPRLVEAAKKDPGSIDGQEIEYELPPGGLPSAIRSAGESFQSGAPAPGAGGSAPSPQPDVAGEFHNPYNFVPTPPRKTGDPDLGDREPSGHDRFASGHYSGRIRVRLTTVTPLLIPDAARVQKGPNEHKTFDVRRDPTTGTPQLAPTSLKGMLRSAYEAVTNSRFGVFQGHDAPLGYRMDHRESVKFVPARVTVSVGGAITVHLMPGRAPVEADGRAKRVSPSAGGPVNQTYAAWLPRWHGGSGSRSASAAKYRGTHDLPQHGEAATAWLEPFERTGGAAFRYWKVREIARAGVALGPKPAPTPPNPKSRHRSVGDVEGPFDGFVCVTGSNIDRKHDERFFFVDPSVRQLGSLTLPLTAPDSKLLVEDWKHLISDYQETHLNELRAGVTKPPALSQPDRTWSRHVAAPGAREPAKSERTLADGTLCHASVRLDGKAWKILALYPVAISRKLFPSAPEHCLHGSHWPATSASDLSPAERVFGWVKTNGAGAVRGKIRVGRVTGGQPSDINPLTETFGAEGMPLAILGAPKPAQARFYLGNEDGNAQGRGLSKEEVGYQAKRQLRGRKVYPHHRSLPGDYWSPPYRPTGRFPEYRRDGDQRDAQNRSIRSWVRPGASFTFDLHVTNLSKVELGALLWLLDLNRGIDPEGGHKRFHRFGGGKPLGFGSVELSIDDECLELTTSAGLRRYYRSLSYGRVAPVRDAGEAASFAESPAAIRRAAIEEFEKAVARISGTSFGQTPFIAAFLQAAEGFPGGLPVHYPRARLNATGPVPPAGESFRWFVENEKAERRRSLPDLVGDPGLPYWPHTPQGGHGGQGGH